VFSTDLLQWARVKGDSTLNVLAVRGTQQMPDPANTPGGLQSARGWREPSGKLKLFSGVGLTTATVSGFFNDLWEFDTATRDWTWLKGSGTYNQQSVFGAIGESNPAYVPGGREAATVWTDAHNNVWFFGGDGLADGGGVDRRNDLWKF